MHKILLALFLLFSFSVFSQAPYGWVEIGVMGGVSNYYGDLTQDYVVPSESHLAFGGFLKVNLNQHIGVKLNVNHGVISADDANSNREDQLIRNLSFISNVTEAALTFEVNLTGLDPYQLRKPISPYLYAGIGGFHFNPKAYFKGEYYDLQPLGTEGQGINSFDFREPYQLNALMIPFGFGVKWAFTEQFNLGLEYAVRFTFTDYLDDVSRTYVDRNLLIEENGIDAYNLSNRSGEVLLAEPLDFDENDFRGDPTTQDWYMFLGLTLSYNIIGGTENGFMSLEKPGLGCFQPKQTRKHNKRNYHSTR